MFSYAYRFDPVSLKFIPGRIQAPVMVRSCGHYIADSHFHDNRLQKFFLELFWGVRGKGSFKFGDQRIELLPKTAFFYLPGDIHDIDVVSYPFEYYWMGIDGPHVSALIDQFGIERRLYETDAAPAVEFDLLRRQILETSLHSEYMAGATAYRILTMAMAGRTVVNSTFEAFAQIVQRRLGDASLTIADIADELGIHRFTLTKLVRSNCQMSPGEYLQACRMQQVLADLRTTNRSIKEIAYEAGFADPNYFAKAVRRRFGLSPSELRQNLPPQM